MQKIQMIRHIDSEQRNRYGRTNGRMHGRGESDNPPKFSIENFRFNKFWYDTLSSWVYMCILKIPPRNFTGLYKLPLWHNPELSKYPLFFPELYI